MKPSRFHPSHSWSLPIYVLSLLTIELAPSKFYKTRFIIYVILYKNMYFLENINGPTKKSHYYLGPQNGPKPSEMPIFSCGASHEMFLWIPRNQTAHVHLWTHFLIVFFQKQLKKKNRKLHFFPFNFCKWFVNCSHSLPVIFNKDCITCAWF